MIITGTGVIWDAENDRPLITFVDGKADVTDKATIAKLKTLGLAGDGIDNGADEQAAPNPAQLAVNEAKAAYNNAVMTLGRSKSPDARAKWTAKVAEAKAALEAAQAKV